MSDEQLTFDDAKGLARNTDPVTSWAAAETVNASRLMLLVMQALRNGPMTTEEIAAVTQESLQSITPRMRPLVNKGVVIDSGTRRPGASGRSRIVWRLK